MAKKTDLSIIDVKNKKSLIVKGKHNPKPDGHGLMVIGTVQRDSIGRQNGSGGNFTEFTQLTCINEACAIEVLLNEYDLAKGVERAVEAMDAALPGK